MESSPFFLDLQDPTPIYAQLADQIRALIDGGSWPTGRQVPPVRALAIELRINPMTVQKVYDLLKQQGYLESRKGFGVFVKGGQGRDPRAGWTRDLEQFLRRGRQMGLTDAELRQALERFLEVPRET